MKQLLICIVFGLIHSAQLQQAEKLTGLNSCSAKINCHECIQTASCAWCSQPDYGQSSRCFQPSMTSTTCPEKYTYQPDNTLTKLKNKELSKGKRKLEGDGSDDDRSKPTGASDNIVQMKPQRVKMQLRINEPFNLDVWYTQAEDYPVDLYYLMDLSKSMEDDKKSLSILGTKLANTMKNITSKFQLGFGSFVDKVAMPYVSIVPELLKAPCTGCAAPYGYRNAMSLSTDTDKFADEVIRSAVSGNLDAPEGGFDAIMQAIVCRKEIGWREKARRLLVFSTDAGFHYAGDGKLAGIIKPNDGKCHLDNKGLYTYSTVQDYPSISQVNMKVKENAINIIFAVTSEQIEVYESLKDHIEGSSAGVLSDDSSNVVELVKNQYSKITSSIEMKDNSTSAVTIKYHSKCLGDGAEVPRRKCDGLKVGDVVKFTAEITVTSCPKNRKDWNQIIQIYPVGIDESLIVDLEMLCDCPCERQGEEGYEEKSESCSRVGTSMCGMCDCGLDHFGEKCECSKDMFSSLSNNNTMACRPDNTTLVDCSGRGTCTCGQCRCQTRDNDQIISGKFCECDNFSCDRHDGLLCSGSSNGRCECGACVCERGWSGKACDCRSTVDTCIPPDGGEECSGHGKCVCGQCVCDAGDEGRYSGQYCDKCHTCSARCEEFKDCVRCQTYKTGPLMEDDKCSKCSFVPSVAESVEAKEENNEYLCAVIEGKCRFSFVYSYDKDEKILIRAQEKLKCPVEVSVLGIVLGVIAAIVLIGIALLALWKVVTTVHDRREFAKFEKERNMAKWDTAQNPIYKEATSTFKNPTYSEQ